jgi:hypothetical protein
MKVVKFATPVVNANCARTLFQSFGFSGGAGL